jgi:molecular chaperone GrpE
MIPDSPDEKDDRPAADGEPQPAEPSATEPEQPSPAIAEQPADAEAEPVVPVQAESAAEAQADGAAAAEAAEQATSELVEPVGFAAPDPLDEARAAFQRTREQLLRTAADFDNYRKRSRREIDDARKQGREELLRDLLPVFDNLERAAAHASQAADAKGVADGVSMVLRQFLDTLGKVGIHRIRAVGQPFDPMQHEAIHQVETADHPAGTVVEEVQPGYATGDRLVRPSMVVVAKAPLAPVRPPTVPPASSGDPSKPESD